ncbi:MAG TPA: SCO family protein [Sphingomicrobium sp.]|nr:SCO family protein [Sphingomicrobium sp.]
MAAPAQAVDPATFQQLSFHQHPGAQLPMNARLVDASGRPATLGNALDGRPAVLVLEYLRCKNLCSLVLSGAVRSIADAGLTPGRDLDLVTISIDPRENARDAAAAQGMYARRLKSAEGVRFYTGSPRDVRSIAATVGFPYRYDKASGQFMHPAGFVVTTPDGKISRYMLGLNPDPAQLRQAVAEAARDEVEPPAHPLLLLCFGYDPDEGTAAALAMRLVRWGSALTVLACLLLVALLSLRRRSA